MQSLIHGNFEGPAQAKVFAMIGAAGSIAAAVGPLLGGLLTTLLSWRGGFLVARGIIAGARLPARAVPHAPLRGGRRGRRRRSIPSVPGPSVPGPGRPSRPG